MTDVADPTTTSGITVPRRFTAAGVDPYSEVEWERRDVIQTDWRTGDVVFEQRNVEFPDFWSVNASTIVATKYFRGALNTDQRETSLRQVIDRVVNTYFDAGVENGYFASVEDAETFRDELKWMLLHQVFAFNSPVWFNVGTASPQQVSACQPYDAPVATEDGYLPIGHIVENNLVGLKVRTAFGLAQVLAVKNNGVKDVFRVTTKSGHVVDATADHLVWRGRASEGAFVTVAELSEGDTLTWHRPDVPLTDDSEMGVPEFEAALAGWLMTDGFVGQYDKGTNRSLTVEPHTINNGEYEWVKAALDAVWPDVHRHERVANTSSEKVDFRRVRLYGEALRPFMAKWGLLTRGTKMMHPTYLDTAPVSEVIAYLRSVFQADGYVALRDNSAQIGISMESESVIHGIQRLLDRLGIFSRVHSYEETREDRNARHVLIIQTLGDRERFASTIGFLSEDKKTALADSLLIKGRDATNVKSLQIAKIENLGPQTVYDIQTDAEEYLSGNIRVHNCFILNVDDSMDSILNWYREEGMIFKGGSGAGLNLSRIRSSKELLRSSGGTASGPVSFMRGADASAGTIKSGGATRRAAKMVVLDVDHPDIEEFVETKMREEDKIRALRDAGFDMELGGRDIVSVQYQNANNSVRVSDLFMSAVEAGSEFGLTSRTTGEVIETVEAKALFRKIAEAAWACADPGIQYDDTINAWHTSANTGRINASNPCSEYMHLDNSSCNLASLNLMKFLREDGTFDTDAFTHAVETVITAMEISISFAHFPTKDIGDTTRRFRQLGIGYANLGALLMAVGLPYDSDEGRSLAAAITALMTGVSYRRSAEIAAAVGTYAGYADNIEPHNRVMRKHAAALDGIDRTETRTAAVADAADTEWADAITLGDMYGYRNAQASVLAPTGCLVPGSLVVTDRGLARIGGIGDADGPQWQDVNLRVATDDGVMEATKFFVNGVAPTRRIRTDAGHVIQGTAEHRVKVVDPQTGEWVWRRFGELAEGDVTPLMLGGMVGDRRDVLLPTLGQAYWTEDRDLFAPETVTEDLAEFVGYFIGDGSLHAKGVRFAIDGQDVDLVEHFTALGKRLFGITAVARENVGYTDLYFNSVRLSLWMEAAGFAKKSPTEGHSGKGWVPHIPAAILETNDPLVYAAFLRGLFEADGSASLGMPNVDTAHSAFADDLRAMLLALGFPTHTQVMSGGQRYGIYPMHRVRIRSSWWNEKFADTIGFLSSRKAKRLADAPTADTMKADYIYLPDAVWQDIRDALPAGSEMRNTLGTAVRKGRVTRALATRVNGEVSNSHLTAALGYVFDTIVANEDGGEQFTYDLSVPGNVTYVANGFISHNTIGFMMDCDTTGVEPDFSLVKFKKMVGGGSLQIVNQQVPRALAALGYSADVAELIVAHILENGNVVDAPGLDPQHYAVFDTAMGVRAISPEGHIHMMAAVQPFLSGAISKTVNLPETATVEDIEHIYLQGWKLGLKAVAVYRDNCKVGQPLSDAKAKSTDVDTEEAVEDAAPEVVYVEVPKRSRLPRKRNASTVSFEVQGSEGYLTTGEFDDGRLGEVFVKMSKQGSTLSGLVDAFSIAVSIGLQYGVPLESFVAKFIGTRFEPAGVTDDQDVRFAQSVVDYVFRRLALDYLDRDTREALGILSADERIAVLDAKQSGGDAVEGAEEPASDAVEKPSSGFKVEAPMCATCGTNAGMEKTGGCWACRDCGSTTGCS